MSRVGVFVVQLFTGVALLGNALAWPEAYWRLPAQVREKATVVVLGTYKTGRGPCEFLADGSRRWLLLQGFTTETVYRGEVRADYIAVKDPQAIGPGGEAIRLVEGGKYLLLLRPSRSSAENLRRPGGSRSYRDALRVEEVVAIVEP